MYYNKDKKYPILGGMELKYFNATIFRRAGLEKSIPMYLLQYSH